MRELGILLLVFSAVFLCQGRTDEKGLDLLEEIDDLSKRDIQNQLFESRSKREANELSTDESDVKMMSDLTDDIAHYLEKRSAPMSMDDWIKEDKRKFGDHKQSPKKSRGARKRLSKHDRKRPSRGKKRKKKNKKKKKEEERKQKKKNRKQKRSELTDKTAIAAKCGYKLEKKCDVIDMIFRREDGSCNNLEFPVLGMSETPFKRILDPAYADGLDEPRKCKNGQELPSARAVTLRLHNHTEPFKPAENHASHICMIWGQFNNHDISDMALTKIKISKNEYEILQCNDADCKGGNEDCFPIEIPANEKSPSFSNKNCIPFTRAEGVSPLLCKNDDTDTREQENMVTSYIDGSTLYGSNKMNNADVVDLEVEDNWAYNGCLLKNSIHPESNSSKAFLPEYDPKFCETKHCSITGDHRADMVSGLAAMHTLWLREHNRIAKELFDRNPQLKGRILYQLTRRLVIAEMQHITYNEYLPMIFGTPFEGTELETDFFTGYDSSVGQIIPNVFSSAANRFGHSMVPSRHWRLTDDFSGLSKPFLFANDTWWRPELLYEGSKPINILNGMLLQEAYKVDRHISDKLTENLFIEYKEKEGLPLSGDLASRNIQRGRDTGTQGYTAWRKECGLSVPKDFTELAELLGDTEGSFAALYGHCSVEDVDLFSAGLFEKPDQKTGGLLGPTFRCLVGKVFKDLKRGDRFWYENDGPFGFTKEQLDEIRKVKLSKVICDNTDGITKFVPEAMKSIFDKENKFKDCSDIEGMDLSIFAKIDIRKLVKTARKLHQKHFPK